MAVGLTAGKQDVWRAADSGRQCETVCCMPAAVRQYIIGTVQKGDNRRHRLGSCCGKADAVEIWVCFSESVDGCPCRLMLHSWQFVLGEVVNSGLLQPPS